MAQQQQQQTSLHTFVLGTKEFEGKTSEFQYDRGWYSITDIVGEERSIIYKSRNANEAYMKWNVYIGRKKERTYANDDRRRNDGGEGAPRNRGDRDGRRSGGSSGKGNRNRRGSKNSHGGKDSYRDPSMREERRDRRRNRGDRSRRDMEAAESDGE
ncbi:MAG: hypothetical protein LUI02_00265 [Clostridiales bacterium]|nr:hypothetical protein [Clostridiales bacterium]